MFQVIYSLLFVIAQVNSKEWHEIIPEEIIPDPNPGAKPIDQPEIDLVKYPGHHGYPGFIPGINHGSYPGNHPSDYPGNHPSGYPGNHPSGYPGNHPSGYPGNRPSGYPGSHPEPEYKTTTTSTTTTTTTSKPNCNKCNKLDQKCGGFVPGPCIDYCCEGFYCNITDIQLPDAGGTCQVKLCPIKQGY